MGKKKHHTGEQQTVDGDATPKLSRKEYEAALRQLQVELVHLQEWVVDTKAKVCVVFEGRDGAGKGGVIKRITERVSPRVFRVVALPAPTERERTQMYLQRYMQHFPAGGEVAIFDRSLVQPRRGRAGHGVLHRGGDRPLPRAHAARRTGDGRFRDRPAQVLARGQSRGADRAASRTASTTAARPGSCRRWTSSRTTAGSTTHAPATPCSPPPTPMSHRGTSPTPTTRSARPQHHQPSARSPPVRGATPEEGRASPSSDARRLPRGRAPVAVRPRTVLTARAVSRTGVSTRVGSPRPRDGRSPRRRP